MYHRFLQAVKLSAFYLAISLSTGFGASTATSPKRSGGGGAPPDLPRPSGWIVDPSGLLSQDLRDQLTQLAAQVERDTSAEMAVVVIQTLGHDTIEGYAHRLFSQWKIGKGGKDNGVLILLSIQDRKVRIETGYGLEPMLPDGLCGEIIRRHMVPHFKANDFSQGLLHGAQAVASVIQQNVHHPQGGHASRGRRHRASLTAEMKFILLIAVLLLIVAIKRSERRADLRRRRGWGGVWAGGWSSGGSSGARTRSGGGFSGFGGGFSGGGGASGSW